MLLRYVHFDIRKFEFEEYSRTNRMNIIKNQPTIFEILFFLIEKAVFIELRIG